MRRRRVSTTAADPPSKEGAQFTASDATLSASSVVAAAVAALAALALALALAHAALGRGALTAHMVATFEAGGVVPSWLGRGGAHWDTHRAVDASSATVPRPALEADLAALLRPQASKQYVLVVGESGTGKSTAVRSALRSLPWPSGAVYFSYPALAPASFSAGLASACGYFRPFAPLASFYEGRGGQAARVGGGSASGDALWGELYTQLQAAAAAYHAKHGRPAVLVLDAADYAAKQQPAFFGSLLSFAKVCADGGALRVVLVCSEGAALPLVRASASAWSRLLKPPYEVPDLPDAQAVQYLVGRGLAQGEAEEAVRATTGGRLALLLDAAAGGAAALGEELAVATGSALRQLRLPPTHAFFARLLAAGRVRGDAALDLLPREALQGLLAAGVLALHPDASYTVQARHVETYLRRAAASAQAGEGPAALAG